MRSPFDTRRLSGPAACKPRGGIDFDRLDRIRERLGIVGDGERWPEEWNDPAFSRQVLGLEDEDG